MADAKVRIDPEDVLPERVDQRLLDREAEIAALRADVDALKQDCEQMDALTERAERAEALLAKATAFKLDSNTRLVQEVISRDEVLWVLVISWKCVGSFASLAAALAAYEQSRETTDA